MQKTIATDGQPVTIELLLEAQQPCIVHIKGFDAEREHSIYFDRRIGKKQAFAGKQTVSLPMPLTPTRLSLVIRNSVSSDNVRLLQTVGLPLKVNEGIKLTEQDRDFINFAQWVAQNSPYLPVTSDDRFPYQSEKGKFMLRLLPQIRNRLTGKVETTPARISRKTGIAELSKSMTTPYTIPMRLQILLHEYMHYKLQTKDELLCDLEAMRIFLALGYSATEALYAYVKVFDDKPHLQSRVKAITEFLYDYDSINKLTA
jgi:hypothetical protein